MREKTERAGRGRRRRAPQRRIRAHASRRFALIGLPALGLAMLAVAPSLSRAAARETVLTFRVSDLHLSAKEGGTVVDYRGAVSGTGAPGSPDLPAVPVFLAVPEAATVERVEAEVLETHPLGVHRLQAVGPPTPANETPPQVELDPAFTASDDLYPEELARFTGRGALRGRNLITFMVRPVRWRPQSGELELVIRLRLRYELVPAPEIALERHRVVAETEARFAKGVGRVLGRPLDAEAREELTAPARASSPSGAPSVLPVAGPGPFQPTFRPTTDGSAVEYVIVTSQALASAFEELAEWKTQKGVQGVVRTVEWIDQTYPNGVDRSERIRFFIRDAYQNWGTLFVLLGGDTDVVPVRYVATMGQLVPSEYYYACLEGNWNADGDGSFGEARISLQDAVDAVDFFPEVYVGRAPVSTLAEAQTFAAKTIDYDRNPGAGNGYPASILYLAERLFPSLDGASIAEDADRRVPPWFKRVKLYEEYASWPGALPETFDSVIDSTNNGFGIVHHIGHGYRNTMSVGEGIMVNGDADALVNGSRQSVVFGINCSAASIDFNSIGERWVKNANGGSIAYIGTSRVAFLNPSHDLQNEWYTTAFVDSVRSLGEVTALAVLPLVPFSDYDNSYRWTLMVLTLIGDPEVDLYTNAAIPLTVKHASAYALGSGAFADTVTSGGVPVSGASVTLWKEGEAFARGTTNATGIVNLPFPAETPGTATLTVHKSYYRPYQFSVAVTGAGGPYLYMLSTLVDDDSVVPPLSGDGDGLVDAGETVELALTVRNGGAAQATGIIGNLSVADPDGYVSILSSTVSYGTIAAGGASVGSSRFVVAIDAGAPEAFQPLFTLTLTSNQGQFSDVFVLPVRRPYLEHYAHTIDDAPSRGNGNGLVESGETIWYTISLRNTGQQSASGVAADLVVVRASDLQVEPAATVIDGQSSFGSIPVDATVSGDHFSFLLSGVDPATILLKVTFNDVHGLVRTEFLDVLPPGVPNSLVAFGSPTSIRITWQRPGDTDILGYDVYRSTNAGGPFQRINTFLAEGSATYEDGGLPALTRYYYQVSARDASFNQGGLSAVVSGSTNPPLMNGWPIALGQQGQSSLQLSQTAGGPDYEIFSAADYQYGWHADGSEIVDGDGDVRTSGVYAPDGYHSSKGFGATCALGDMDGDGTIEVANVGWNVTQAYVWDNQGQLKPGWPKSVMDNFNWSSPVMTDLDLDGDLELVYWAAKGGRLFAWHHDGTEVADGDQDSVTSGVLYRVTGTSYCYSSPAVANLDADPMPEIVFCVNGASDNSGGIYVLNGDGSLVPNWPRFTGGPTTPSQITASPAIGDLDQNGTNEIVVASERDGGKVHVLRADGTDFPGWPKSVAAVTAGSRTSSPVLADLDQDSFLDVVFAAADGRLWAWNRNGGVLAGFPAVYYAGAVEATQSTPTLGDIDGDTRLEILFGDETGRLHAYKHDGTAASGFPIQLTGEVRGAPTIWDFDNDGLMEVGTFCWDGSVYIWNLPGAWNLSRIPWPFSRHDVANTGYVGTPIMVGTGVIEPAPGAPPIAVLYPPHPNPFNPRTTIAFDVPGLKPAPVTLAIYDVEGRMVARLVDGGLPPGRHAVTWDGRGASGHPEATGVYFCRVTIGDFGAARKLTLVK